MASVIRDTGEIWSRLFDHRPFIQGEIRFFLREFQEKRNDREIERLFKILEDATELRDHQFDRAEQLGDCHLPGLKVNVDVALSMCERVLEGEANLNVGRTLQRIENTELRRAEWERFVDDMNVKCEKVNEYCKKQEIETRENYYRIEQALDIPSPTLNNSTIGQKTLFANTTKS